MMARFEPAVGALLLAFDGQGLEPDSSSCRARSRPPSCTRRVVEHAVIWL